MTEQEWIQLAKRRVLRILRRRRFASLRQLEKKTAEAGPGDMRPGPIKISKGLQELLNEDFIEEENIETFPKFYKARDFGGATDEPRRALVVELTDNFRRLTGNSQVCGKALERIVYKAVLATNRYRVIGTPERPPGQGLALNGYVLEKECDHLLVPKDFEGPVVVVEDKNLREWLHPSAEEVWAVIGKALRIPNAIPVLICRKMHFVGYTIFRHIGLACWQVFRQYFAPEVEDDLVDIRHRDGLGFSDVTTDTTAPPALIHFFAATIPTNIGTFAGRFEKSRPLLQKYAIDEGLEREIPPPTRRRAFAWFQDELRLQSEHRRPDTST